jgi:prepilin-type N-terminal cleavage/methylation domain-containing protein
MKNKSQFFIRGFTLIELLVVIAIITLLTGIVVANLTTSRAKARDAKRISDLSQIQLALELYFDRCNEYPFELDVDITCSNYPEVTLGMFMSKIPSDPSYSGTSLTRSSEKGGTPVASHPNYAYYVNTIPNRNGSSQVTDYILKAVLETQNEVLKDSYDGSTDGFFDSTDNSNTPASFDCESNVDEQEYNYCIVPK